MSVFTKTRNLSNENFVFSYFKGLILSIVISFAFVILLAFCLKWFPIIENYLFLATMIIKIISTLVGSIIAIKGENGGLIKGVFFGLLYILTSFVIFSFLAGSFNFDNQTILDFIICAITGAIVGIIKVNK